MPRLMFVIYFFLTSMAQAYVIETNEWDNLTKPNWFYGGGLNYGGPVDFSAGSPSGGGAIKFTYRAGTQTESITGGIARYQYQQNYSEVYVGHWIKWSSNWMWHPVGSKIDYFDANLGSDGSQSNVLTAIWGDGANTGGCRSGVLQTVQRVWGVAGTYNMPQNKNVNFCPGQWYWVEWHLKMNTPGAANGIYELRVNGDLISSVSDMALAGPLQNGYWQNAQHSPEYGGGGAANIPSEQYIWIDHTVISTTPIGVPGGAAPPPAPVTSPTTGTAAAVNAITLLSDLSGTNISFDGLAFKIRYWNDLINQNSAIVVSGLGEVSTYKHNVNLSNGVTFVCYQAQGSDGIWQVDFRCVPVNGAVLAKPKSPMRLRVL